MFTVTFRMRRIKHQILLKIETWRVTSIENLTPQTSGNGDMQTLMRMFDYSICTRNALQSIIILHHFRYVQEADIVFINKDNETLIVKTINDEPEVWTPALLE